MNSIDNLVIVCMIKFQIYKENKVTQYGSNNILNICVTLYVRYDGMQHAWLRAQTQAQGEIIILNYC